MDAETRESKVKAAVPGKPHASRPEGLSGVCGMVVTFHPEAEAKENISAMARECGRLLIVDNGSRAETCAWLAAIPGTELLALGENLGVAAALNRGALWAEKQGCEWVLTFDQDSRPQAGMLAALWARHLELPLAAVIAPKIEEPGISASPYQWVRRNPRWPGLFKAARTDSELEEVTMAITSGSLIQLTWWRKLGCFDDNLFIDYVDIDYCLRVIRAGRSVAIAPAAGLDHRLGNRRTLPKFGHDFRPMNHAVFRHYYIARNRVCVWRRHALAVPHWALFDLCFATYNTFRVLAFEAEKTAKIKAMILGTWDGLQGKTGALSEERNRQLKR